MIKEESAALSTPRNVNKELRENLLISVHNLGFEEDLSSIACPTSNPVTKSSKELP
jgi:hypothetical protein